MTEQNLKNNFKLSEFLYSRFYDEETQAKVIEEYHKDIQLHFNILKLADNLQVLRDFLGKPVIIRIAYRPLFWELEQERDGTSQHVLCLAADIEVKGVTHKQLKDVIQKLIDEKKMSQGGLENYSWGVHYDCRGYKARW